MQTGCVKPSSTPYTSPLVFVRKKEEEGGLRVCVDYSNINLSMVLNCYPILRIDELVDIVGCRSQRYFHLWI